MPLQITRSFVENRDGTYDVYELPSRAAVEGASEGIKHQTPIRPFELKTYLRVGELCIVTLAVTFTKVHASLLYCMWS